MSFGLTRPGPCAKGLLRANTSNTRTAVNPADMATSAAWVPGRAGIVTKKINTLTRTAPPRINTQSIGDSPLVAVTRRVSRAVEIPPTCSIYRKLEVTSRSDAVRVAKELDLLR